MKRFIAVLLVVLATACLMTGCSSGMKDGTYKAQFKDCLLYTSPSPRDVP